MRCEWCEDVRTGQILESLLSYVQEYLDTHEPSSPHVEPALAFVADIGELATKHPYFSSLKKVLTMLIEKGVVKRLSSAERIWDPNLLLDAKRLLPLFKQIGLCSFSVDKTTGLITLEWPPKAIVRRAHAWLQTEPGRNETASFLLGYTLLHALQETIRAIDRDGKLGYNEGIARIYPMEYSDKGEPTGLRFPKGFTAVLSFLFVSWARGWNEFDELSLQSFLRSRGVTGREFSLATGLLSQTVPGISHAILEFETYTQGGPPIKRFHYSERVRLLRDNLRGRLRERSGA
jgi:hypothetical protein